MMLRTITTSVLQTKAFCAAVVGSGPAGVAAVGQLLDSDLAQSVAWIDPKFNGGRLEVYKEVPSNTKAGLFVTYGEACKAFGGPGNAAVATLRQLRQDQGCRLGYAHDLVCALTASVRQQPTVQDICGTVTTLEQVGNKWRLSVEEHAAVQSSSGTAVQSSSGTEVHQPTTLLARAVFLATGSHPRSGADIGAPHLHSAARTGAAAPAELPLDVALCPSALQQVSRPEDEVAVVGSSHSAVLALKNLAELPTRCRPKRIVNFYRSPLLYAEYKNDEHGQWILRDNTGLKGLAAEWAKQHLDPSAASSIPGLQRMCIAGVPGQTFDEGMPGCTKIVYAVGYTRNPLPQLIVDGNVLPPSSIGYDALTGQLLNRVDHTPLRGLYGYGIAFPEAWTDPLGNKELAVGMFKFMRYLKNAVPAAMTAATA